MKAGKTSFSVRAPKNLLVAFEIGYNALPGVMAVPIAKWSDFKKILRQLESEEMQEKFHTITIDTVTIAWQKVEEYICGREGVSSIADIKWGGGYTMCKTEFENTLRKITHLGYGLICLAHAEEKPISQKDPENTIIKPLLNKRAYEIVNGLVDIIGYISVEFKEDGTSERFLYTRSTPNLFAGSRFQYLKEKIPFGYDNLVKELADAIEKSAGGNNELITDERINYEEIYSRSFVSAMEEAKEVWLKLVDNDEKLDKAFKIVEDNFGKEMKLSEAKPEQQEIVENIILELKKLL